MTSSIKDADPDVMTITFKLGKAAPDHSRRALLLVDHLTGIPVPPSQRDWLGRVASWPMYKNDELGDCVWAMIGHAIQAWTTYATGTTVEVPVDALLKAYSDVTGWNPADPSTDQGTVIQDALNYWKKTGVSGHRILAFAKVNHTDANELKTAIEVFGALMVGINCPNSALDQFDAAQAWSVLPDDGGNAGGHAIHLGAYDPSKYQVVTWAKVQDMTPEFATKYLDEAWVVITAEWLSAVGQSPDGLDLQGLGEALSALTGEPNPFPTNPPAPTPPTPSANPDGDFASVLHPWLSRRHFGACRAIAAAAKHWLSERGL